MQCKTCRAYINPFVSWSAQQWPCNLCGMSNEVSKQYHAQSLQGARNELQYGCVEIVAPDEYCVRTLQTPSYLFKVSRRV